MELNLIHEYSTRDRDLSFLAFSPDGRLLASYAGVFSNALWQVGTLKLRDADSDEDLHEFQRCVGTARFLKQGARVLCLQLGKKRLFGAPEIRFVSWDTDTFEEVDRRTCDAAPEVFHNARIAFSPRNAVVYPARSRSAYVIGWDRQLFAFDLKTGACLGGFAPPNVRKYRSAHAALHPWQLAAVAVSPYGKLALWGDEQRFLVRRLTGQTEWIEFPKQHQDWVNTASFSPDSRRVLTGAKDGVRYWDVELKQPIGNVMYGAEGMLGKALSNRCPECIVFTPGGNEAVFGLSRGAVLFDLRTQTPIAEMPLRTPVNCAAFSPDGGKLALGTQSGTVSVWEIPIPDPPRTSGVEANAVPDLQMRLKSTNDPAKLRRILKDNAELERQQEAAKNRRAGAARIGEFYCPHCREQNTALDADGFLCGSCGAKGDTEAVATLAATFNFRTGERFSIE